MEIISVTKENLEEEHICCAISNNNDCQVASKKKWISEALDHGLVFKKCAVRGKCFIEYIPAEEAWSPIEAKGYMFINCLWVSGKFKGHGNANLLLEECIRDSKAKEKLGIAILSSEKKKPFLSDPRYLKYKGFSVADKSEPYYELLYLPFEENAARPSFKEHVKIPKISQQGFVLYYSNQCPFTVKYVPLIKKIAEEKEIPFKSILIETAGQAQEAPAPFTSYSMFFNGEFLTNEILSEKKFQKIIASNKL